MRKKIKVIFSIVIYLCICLSAIVFYGCDSTDPVSYTDVIYPNINGREVSLKLLTKEPYDSFNNPTFYEAELINNCIKYKQKHPSKEVSIGVSTFHFSIVASACLDTNNADYGKMKSLYETEEEGGYVRLAYLLIKAAKIGINVTLISQLDASATLQYNDNNELAYKPDYNFYEYYKNKSDEDCEDILPGKKVKDYLRYYKTGWTSYGDRAASDMLHLKVCLVSHYIDNSGAEKEYGMWMSSTNIDGIDYRGKNGNDGRQTGYIVTNHFEIYNCAYNYFNLCVDYSGQEQIYEFRDIVLTRNEEQYKKIIAGEGDTIPEEEQILYLGTENDKVFELYFTPLAGAVGAWDTRYNPIAKYTSKLVTSENYILYGFYNVKCSDCQLTDNLISTLNKAYRTVNNPKSLISIEVTVSEDIKAEWFNDIVIGKNCGYKAILVNSMHNKDVIASYVEDGTRHFVTIISSSNYHDGAYFYQANSFLVVNETSSNDFFLQYGYKNSHELMKKYSETK